MKKGRAAKNKKILRAWQAFAGLITRRLGKYGQDFLFSRGRNTKIFGFLVRKFLPALHPYGSTIRVLNPSRYLKEDAFDLE